jgi:hypothetical protein
MPTADVGAVAEFSGIIVRARNPRRQCFPYFFLLADPFCFRKITTDPHTLDHAKTQCVRITGIQNYRRMPELSVHAVCSKAGVFNLSDSAGHINNFSDAPRATKLYCGI